MGEIGHQILDYVHARKRSDPDFAVQVFDRRSAGQAVFAVEVHRAGSADAFAAGTAEGQRRVDLVLDLDQRIQNHWAALVEVDFEIVIAWVLAAIGIVTIDLELADPRPTLRLVLAGLARDF